MRPAKEHSQNPPFSHGGHNQILYFLSYGRNILGFDHLFVSYLSYRIENSSWIGFYSVLPASSIMSGTLDMSIQSWKN